MKNNLILFPFISFLLLSSISCDKDCAISPGISGKWEWIKSTGGFSGGTITPATEGKTSHLIIDDFTYEQFVNDSSVYKSQYDLQIRETTYFGTNRYISFEGGSEYAIILSGNEMQLLENQWSDGYTHFYERQ